MRLLRLFAAAGLACALFSTPAAAQAPDTGLVAVGGDAGVFFPDEAFENTFTIDGYGEYFVTPRISVRAMLAWAKPGFENLTEDKFRQTKLLFNGLYNWEYEEWHPFVTAGAGAYFVRLLLGVMAAQRDLNAMHDVLTWAWWSGAPVERWLPDGPPLPRRDGNVYERDGAADTAGGSAAAGGVGPQAPARRALTAGTANDRQPVHV